MKKWLLVALLLTKAFAQQFNSDIIPASPGLRIGHSNQRWNGFFKNIDISGSCIVNGAPCGSGGGGTSIGTFTVATLPPNPPINTYAFVTDANGPSCTIGGSTTTNLCRFNAFQWVIVSGGTGASSSFTNLTGGTSSGQQFIVGSGSSMIAGGSGFINATNVPVSKPLVGNQWLNSYDSVGKTFTSAGVAYSQITGNPRVDTIQTSTGLSWLAVDSGSINNGHFVGLNFSLQAGSALIFPVSNADANVQVEIDSKGTSPVVIGQSSGGVSLTGPVKIPNILSACLEADGTGTIHAASGGLCGSGGGLAFPLNAPDGSSTSAQYTFTNHPELGMAVSLDGDKPQVRQIVVVGAGPGQTITATISAPLNNLSIKAGDRLIMSGLPATPTDLTSLNISSPTAYVISSSTATSPTGTITFSTASTTIAAGTYSVTSGNVQVYGGFLVGRSFQFNRLESSTTNPAQSGSIRFAARDAVKARAGQPDDTTLDISHVRGSATISPTNSPGTGIMTVNGAHSSGATTLSIAKGATAWSAVAGDQFLIASSNGDSDNQKYSVAANITVAANANTSITITPALKTALNGGELIVTRFIRTQLGEESGTEIPGDTELKGNFTITSTSPTLFQVKKQSSTPTLNTAYDAGWFLNSSGHFQCLLSVALGSGDCTPQAAAYNTVLDEAIALTSRTNINFTGAGVTCVDNAGATRTDCTIPGGAGVGGSGTTSKIPKWASSSSLGDSTADDGLTTANAWTISATAGLNLSGGPLRVSQTGTCALVAGFMGFCGTSGGTNLNLKYPANAGNGFFSWSNTSNTMTGVLRSFAASSPITVTNADGTAGNVTYACATCSVTGNRIDQNNAATTSAQFAGVVTDELGTGKVVFATALQGTDGNVQTAGTVSGTGNALCVDANGGTTTAGCQANLAPVTLTDAATITWTLSSTISPNATVTLGGNRTINLSGPVSGVVYLLRILQDGTGSRTLALGTGCTWKVSGGGAGAITLSTAASSIDILSLYYDGTNCYANLNKNFN